MRRFFALILSLAGSVSAATLEDLDATLRKGGSVSGFLARPELVDEYFRSAQSYYGGEEKFSRAAYDAILAQLRQVLKGVPELEARLWETSAQSYLGQPFRIQSALRSSGRRVESSAWNQRLDELETSLGRSPAPKESWSTFSARVNQETQNLRTSPAYAQAGKRERARLEMDLALRQRSDPDLKAWAAQLARSALRRPELRELLEAKDADLVLGAWESFLARPGSYLGKALPSIVASELRARLPSVSELLADPKTFVPMFITDGTRRAVPVPAQGPATFEAKVLPRRFHSLMKGVRLGECVGGSCGSLDSLTPERTLTGALKDAEILYLERNGKHLGFFEAVPGEVGGHTVASVSFGAPEFRNLIYVPDAQGKIVARPLFSLWIEQVDAHKPAGWKGLAVSNLDHVNNAGVLGDLRASAHYVFGRKQTLAPGAFTLTDPLAHRIPAIVPRQGHAAHYGGRWVLDATASPQESRMLTLLQSHAGIDVARARELAQAGDSAPIRFLAKRASDHPSAPETASFLPLLVEAGDGGTHWTLAQFVYPKLDVAAARPSLQKLVKLGNPTTLNALALHYFSKPVSVGAEDALAALIERADDTALASLVRGGALAQPRPHSAALSTRLRELAGPQTQFALNAAAGCGASLGALFAP